MPELFDPHGTPPPVAADEALLHPWDRPPPLGEAREVAPGVHWLRMPLPFALDHINLWLLEDGDDWVAVDTGFPSRQTKTAWESLLAGRRVGRICVTHFHPDHVGLAGWLAQKEAAPVLMSRLEFTTAHLVKDLSDDAFNAGVEAFYRRHGLEEERLTPLLREGNSYAASVTALPEEHEALRQGDRLVVGGRVWEVVVGEGHAPEQATLYCEALKVLIAGDMILPEITPNISTEFFDPEANPLEDYLRSLTRFEGLAKETLVLPSHRLPFQGLKTRIAQLRRHHEERLQRLREALESGPKTAAELIPALFDREIEGYGVYFAMGEAIAHADYLAARGEIERFEEAGLARYRR